MKLIEPRKSLWRQCVDPHGTLPYISYLEYPSNLIGYESFHGMNEQGRKIIDVSLGIDQGKNRIFFETIYRLMGEQGHIGEGLAAYVLAIEYAASQKMAFGSSPESLSPSALKIWGILERAGVAVLRGDIIQLKDEGSEHTDRFSADFAVIDHPMPPVTC